MQTMTTLRGGHWTLDADHRCHHSGQKTKGCTSHWQAPFSLSCQIKLLRPGSWTKPNMFFVGWKWRGLIMAITDTGTLLHANKCNIAGLCPKEGGRSNKRNKGISFMRSLIVMPLTIN